MRRRLFAMLLGLCLVASLSTSMALAEDVAQDGAIATDTSGLCEHHTQHDESCGYTEGMPEQPCTHEHTDDCYVFTTACTHTHTAECYSDGILPAEGEEKAADACSHQCSEESGCITRTLDCKHEHDAACGYAPATEGTPCTFVCEICNAQEEGGGDAVVPPSTQPVEATPSSDPSDVQQTAECTCETLCTGDSINADCPVCSAEGAELDKVCVGTAPIAPMSPATALAVEGAPHSLYVGNTSLSLAEDSYWTTDPDTGLLTQYTGSGDDWNVKYELSSNTLTLNEAKISGSYNEYNNPFTAGIYAKGSSNQSVALTIELIGTNTITGNYGIYVDAQQGETVGANASLLIRNSSDNGILEVSGSSHGIYVKSGTGNASLAIKDASVVASSSSSYDGYAGVCVQSSSDATSSPTLSLAVDGGSLTTSASEGNDGIQFYVGSSQATGATTSLTVTDNAIVDARNGGISADGASGNPNVSTGSTSGIVFDGTEGTVYGDMTLDESLTIAQGETLTIPQGSTLNANGNLTNNGTIVNTGGTLNGELDGDGTIETAPAITTESLPEGTAGQPYTATLEATGNNITWSASDLPAGLTLDANTGAITGTPTADGQFPVTITATNSVGNIDRTYTLNIKPATVSVTGLKLDKDSLTLQENGSDTLTAIVEPADATNKAVTWASSDNNIATVSEDGTVTAISAGNATITATAADGSGISASCNLTVTHGNMVQTPKEDAACTVDGTEEYWTCEICGKHYKDESGTIPTTPEENKIPATGHNYGEPEWNWSEDGKTCTVIFTCANDETHKEMPEATVTSAVKTPATCTEAGVTTYTATAEFNGQTYTDTKDVADVPATGHSWGEPVWSWSEDGKTCTVVFACANDPTHMETPEVTVSSSVKIPATCTETGTTEYTATTEFNETTYTGTMEVADIPATGHTYENGRCTVCSAIDPEAKVFITAGANGTWQKGSKSGLSFTSNAAYADFQKVQVDGKDLDASNYDVKEGSTVVTLTASYLETLPVGKHTLAIVSVTGTAATEFTVNAAAEQPAQEKPSENMIVRTGDRSITSIATLSVLAAISFTTGGLVLRRLRS